MNNEKRFNEALIQHLRTKWQGTERDDLLQQVGVALGVEHTATSDIVLLEVWENYVKTLPAPAVSFLLESVSLH